MLTAHAMDGPRATRREWAGLAGLAPLRAGLWTLPSTGGLVAGSMLAPLIVRRMRPASAITGGLVVAATGFALLTRVDPASGLTVVVTASVILALGIGAVGTLATDLIVGTAPPDRAGAASALSETSSELGGALGIAVLGSVATVAYRGQMAGAVPPGVPPQAAAAGRDTLGGALAAAQELPAQLGGILLAAAREAFTQGLQVTAAASVAMVIGIAVLAAVTLRGTRPGDAQRSAQPAETSAPLSPPVASPTSTDAPSDP